MEVVVIDAYEMKCQWHQIVLRDVGRKQLSSALASHVNDVINIF